MSKIRPRPNSNPPKESGRPTHFVGIRIAAPTALNEIRAAVRQCSPGISGYMEEACKAHVTLGVLRLDTDECVQRCVADFRRAARKLRREKRALFPGGVLRASFDGFGMFGSRVLFLKPSEASISQLREMRACLLDEVDMRQEFHEFNPHLTIAKRTRWVSKRRATDSPVVTRMPDDASVFDDVRVQVEACVTSVELLKMRGDQEEDEQAGGGGETRKTGGLFGGAARCQRCGATGAGGMFAQPCSRLQPCTELSARGAFVLATGRGQAAGNGGGFLGVIADLYQRGLHVAGQRCIGTAGGIDSLRGHRGDALGLVQALLPLR